jgi:hypothetical protein
MLGYRAINDENRSVRFESLKALMEIAEPGSTKDGKIIGQEPTAEGRDHAVQEIVKFMDFNKNPDVVEEWLQYLGKNIYQEKIEMALVKFLQKRMERFLPRNRQKKTVQAASAMVRKKLQKMKISKGPALDFLLKTQESKNHRDAAQEAKRALAEIKRLEEDLAAGKVKEKAQDKQLEPVKDKAPLKIKK